MIRPTTAQLATSADLLALARDASTACGVAVSVVDLDTLHEVITCSRALVRLVDGSEAWIEPARAHIAVSGALVAAVIRRGEQR